MIVTGLGCLTATGAEVAAGHPRVLARPGVWEELRERRQRDVLLDELVSVLRVNAESILAQPPVERRMTGRRLLAVSRDVLSRTLTLGVVYKLEGDGRFLRRALEELAAAAEFADWNPAHFLDTAEMCAALGIGYDWFYGEMPPELRERVRGAIVAKAFGPALGGKHFWQTHHNNWNAVCWGGLVIGALAVADEEPEMTGKILSQARGNIVMKAYAPDGVYPEGPMYWNYGTTYLALLVASLESALGTDWGLAAAPGFRESAEWQARLMSSPGRFFNFFDAREAALPTPALYWFAARYADDGVLAGQEELLRAALAGFRAAPLMAESGADKSRPENARVEMQRFLPLTVLWWRNPAGVAPRFAKDAAGSGPNPVAMFRDAWDNPRGLFLGLKGGQAGLPHGHMDAGSFVLDLHGRRWACDLGMQEYHSLESRGFQLWGEDRWKVFRINNLSHNTLTVNNRPHHRDGAARITAFSAGAGRAMVDLTPVFKGQAASVTREFLAVSGSGVRIEDKLDGLQPGDEVVWRLLTPARVELTGSGIILTQDGEAMELRWAAAGGDVTPAARPADPPADYDAPNPGITMITLTVTAATGTLTLNTSLLAK